MTTPDAAWVVHLNVEIINDEGPDQTPDQIADRVRQALAVEFDLLHVHMTVDVEIEDFALHDGRIQTPP